MNRVPLAICVVLAWALARRVPSPRQRVIVAALTGLLALDVVRLWRTPGSDFDVATFALWYAVGALAAWSVLAKSDEPETFAPGPFFHLALTPRSSGSWRSRFGVLLSLAVPFRSGSSAADWTLIVLALVAIASPIAYRCSVDVARVAFALSLAAQVLAALRFASRGRWPDDAQRVALILAASTAADLAGPWRVGMPADFWYVQNVTSALTWAAICGWEIRCLTRARR